jgi:class 3 adenylate cyclase
VRGSDTRVVGSEGSPPVARVVGREPELSQLDAYFSEATMRGPVIVGIHGEAGIGKSRLLLEAGRRAQSAGFGVHVGTCHEAMAVPHLPLLVAFSNLGTEVPALAYMRGPAVGGVGVSETVHGKILVDLGVQLAATARRRPLVLVVDDLHWADQGTLDVLAHLAAAWTFEAATDPVPIALVVAHRPLVPEVVARILDRLGREPRWRALGLEGLAEPALHELITSETGEPPSRHLLHEVAEASGGNPFVVRSMVQRLIDTGRVVSRGGRLVKVHAAEPVVALAGLDEELTHSLGRLDTACRNVLTVAAFLGAEGELDDLEGITGLAPEDLDELIAQAARAGVVSVDATTYRFEHPQLRRLLIDTPVGRERSRLHLRVADQLERSDGSARMDRAIELARHLRLAGSLVDPARLARCNAEAGWRALTLGAWSDAATAFEASLVAAGDGEVDGQDRLAVLIGCGRAHFRDHNLEAAEPRLEEAVALAEARGDLDAMTSAAVALARGRLTLAGGSSTAAMAPLDRALEAGPLDARLRCNVLSLQAEVLFAMNEFDRAMDLCDDARDLARSLGDDMLVAAVDQAAGLQHLGRLEFAEAADQFVEGAAAAVRGGDLWLATTLLGRLPLARFGAGDLIGAARAADDHIRDAAALQNWSDQSLSSALLVSICAVQGRFAMAEHHGAVSRQSFRWSEYQFTPALLFPALAAARAARGDFNAASAALLEWSEVGGRSLLPVRVLVALASGSPVAAAELPPWRPIGRRNHGIALAPIVAQVELGVALGDRELVDDVLPTIIELWERGVRWTLQWPASIARLAAAASRIAGDLESARRWLDDAEDATRVGAAPAEAARVALERARVLVASGESAAAVVDAYAAAVRAADACGLVPLLAGALAEQRDLLGPASPASVTPGRRRRVVMVTDLVESTPLLMRLGDEGYLDLFRYLGHVVRRRVSEHGGLEFKHLGDGIDVWFDDPVSAVRCAQAVVVDLAEHNAASPDRALHLRCGLAAGEAVGDEAGDIFGRTVVEAARICALATGGQVLIADAIRRAIEGTTIGVRFVGDVELKGLPGPARLHEVLPPL